MRKSFKSLVSILFVLIFASQVFAVDGVVTYVKGKVEVNRGSAWVQLNVGDKVSQSEMINTGFQSEAKVKLMNSVLYLGPVTRVTLDTLASNNEKDKVNVYLSTGNVRSKVNRTDNKKVSYTVRTPIAVASVRGTDYSVSNTEVTCYKGTVGVSTVKALNDGINGPALGSTGAAGSTGSTGSTSSTGSDDSTAKASETIVSPSRGLSKEGLANLTAFEDGQLGASGEITVTNNQRVQVGESNLANFNPMHTFDRGIKKIQESNSTEANKQAIKADVPISTSTKPEVIEEPKTGSISIIIRLPN